MRVGIMAAISGAALAIGAGLVAIAQPPAETRDPNKAAYTPAFAGQTRAPALTTDTRYEVKEVVASGLASPWAVEFLPGGRFLITERIAGQFRIADAAGKVSAPIKSGVPVVHGVGQGGLLDVALDPNFATHQMIYWS
jgi:glucose/arabinose dehydrogenase